MIIFFIDVRFARDTFKKQALGLDFGLGLRLAKNLFSKTALKNIVLAIK